MSALQWQAAHLGETAAQVIRDWLENGRSVFIETDGDRLRVIAAKRRGQLTLARSLRTGEWVQVTSRARIVVERN